MNTHARKAKLLTLLSLLVVILVSGLSACGDSTNAQSKATPSLSTPPVVLTYFKIFNAGMRSGDFSALASVYSPDATLTRSTTKGVTTVFYGIDAIIRWYEDLWAKYPGYQ